MKIERRKFWIVVALLAIGTTAVGLFIANSSDRDSAYTEIDYRDSEVGWAEFHQQNEDRVISGGEDVDGGVPTGLHTLKVYTDFPSQGGEFLFQEPVYLAKGFDYHIDIYKNRTEIRRIDTAHGEEWPQ